MPTMPRPPTKLFKDMYTGGPLERLSRTAGVTTNTAPFNSSGHPCLTLPVGFASAEEDDKVMLPVGMQITGRKFEDLLCMKVAAAWEKSHDWKVYKVEF
jgi:amidase